MDNNIEERDYKTTLVESIRKIDTEDLDDDVNQDTKVDIVNKQKVYFWIRLYMKEENNDIKIGNKINIKWLRSGESLDTIFTAYGKKGLEKDEDGITESKEDDNRILCLMVDSEKINYSKDIPFIRTLFRTGYHYEDQLKKRDELIFYKDEEDILIDYYDIDF
jgi:hypothetical protein